LYFYGCDLKYFVVFPVYFSVFWLVVWIWNVLFWRDARNLKKKLNPNSNNHNLNLTTTPTTKFQIKPKK